MGGREGRATRVEPEREKILIDKHFVRKYAAVAILSASAPANGSGTAGRNVVQAAEVCLVNTRPPGTIIRGSEAHNIIGNCSTIFPAPRARQ